MSGARSARTLPPDSTSSSTGGHRTVRPGRLRLMDAAAIGIGGMIGGAIFSALGVTIQLAGHLAFASVLLAGGLALVTAHSYAGLSRRSEHPRGPYACLRD